VDSFQGSEEEYVIISYVRCNDEIGFLSDERRLNVSWTRAKHLVISVGNMKTMTCRDSYLKQYWEMLDSDNKVYKATAVSNAIVNYYKERVDMKVIICLCCILCLCTHLFDLFSKLCMLFFYMFFLDF
jgi:hypothetical protein